MAKLTKDQYMKRSENAAKRMVESAKNDLLTQEQHDALAFLCSARHELHSNIGSVAQNDENGLKQAIITANYLLIDSGLKPMSFVGTDESDYIDIDSIDELHEVGESVDLDEDLARIISEIENLNSKIEGYLSEIDEKYFTNYCPTGAQRVL